jgi:hypothetical protein
MSKLNNIELNVLEVALDHMREHLEHMALPHMRAGVEANIQGKLAALGTLKAKLL